MTIKRDIEELNRQSAYIREVRASLTSGDFDDPGEYSEWVRRAHTCHKCGGARGFGAGHLCPREYRAMQDRLLALAVEIKMGKSNETN